MLLFCRGRQRNVQRFITQVHSYCLAIAMHVETTTATKASPKKRFNEKNNGCASSLLKLPLIQVQSCVTSALMLGWFSRHMLELYSLELNERECGRQITGFAALINNILEVLKVKTKLISLDIFQYFNMTMYIHVLRVKQ